jgi:hypothetical protein
MEYIVGIALAVVICGAATFLGLDRDRVFYPFLLMVVASYYVLFAVMGGGNDALLLEIGISTAFFVVAIAGFKWNLWLVAVALAGHGAFDFTHHLFFQNHGVPAWWPGFCLAFDFTAALFFGALLVRRSRRHVTE